MEVESKDKKRSLPLKRRSVQYILDRRLTNHRTTNYMAKPYNKRHLGWAWQDLQQTFCKQFHTIWWKKPSLVAYSSYPPIFMSVVQDIDNITKFKSQFVVFLSIKIK